MDHIRCILSYPCSDDCPRMKAGGCHGPDRLFVAVLFILLSCLLCTMLSCLIICDSLCHQPVFLSHSYSVKTAQIIPPRLFIHPVLFPSPVLFDTCLLRWWPTCLFSVLLVVLFFLYILYCHPVSFYLYYYYYYFLYPVLEFSLNPLVCPG